MSKKSTKSTKKTAGKGKAAQPAAPGIPDNVTAPPAPEALGVHAEYDREKEKWFWSIREGKTEHFASADGVASDDKAKDAGAKWLAKYAKANEAGRRKMLGWKGTDAAHLAAVAKADQENARLRDVREKSPDGMTASERAMDKSAGKTKSKQPKPKRVSGLDAAAQVLKDAGKPMGCSDIVETMLTKGMWKTGGKTPAATIYAAIIREIGQKKNESRFKKSDRGMFEYHAPATSGTGK